MRERLWQLPQLALRADLISFNSAISACGTAQQWQLALALLQGDTLFHYFALLRTFYNYIIYIDIFNTSVFASV